MKARIILLIALPALLLGLAILPAVGLQAPAEPESRDAASALEAAGPDSTAPLWDEQGETLRAGERDSLEVERERPGIREKLRRRVHMIRMIIDVVLGLVERGIGSADLNQGA